MKYMQRRVGLVVLTAALVMPVLQAGAAAAQPGGSMVTQTTSGTVSGDTPDGVIWVAPSKPR